MKDQTYVKAMMEIFFYSTSKFAADIRLPQTTYRPKGTILSNRRHRRYIMVLKYVSY